MSRPGLALLLGSLLAAALPVGAAGDDDPRCFYAPELLPSYEWAYVALDGTERYEEVTRANRANSGYGYWNMTTIGFYEERGGERLRWGSTTRFGGESRYFMGTVNRLTHQEVDGRVVQTAEVYHAPAPFIMETEPTCVAAVWTFETLHGIVGGHPPSKGQRNETWQVRVLPLQEITVPAGTFTVFPIRAVRLEDTWVLTHYWSKEVRAPVRVEEGPLGAPPVQGWDLTWYVLDTRPKALFSFHPPMPVVGDTITLDATASQDREGPIAHYEWSVNGESREGSVVVTDEAGRASSVSHTLYVAPRPGEGLAVDGPLAAAPGDFVALTALSAFDPVRVRWREGSNVVGDGPTFAFRMNGTRTLAVDAFHPSGRVFTAEHTVVQLNESEVAALRGGTADEPGGGRDIDERSWPRGGSSVLAVLAPLEGNVVPRAFDVHVWTSEAATLRVDGREVWSGGGPEALVPVELGQGRHEIALESVVGRHVVNVTVAGDGPLSDPVPSMSESPSRALPWPGTAIGVLALLASIFCTSRRR